jgi:hypothetical protein
MMLACCDKKRAIFERDGYCRLFVLGLSRYSEVVYCDARLGGEEAQPDGVVVSDTALFE